MKCPSCHAEVLPGGAFCGHCGRNLAQDIASPASRSTSVIMIVGAANVLVACCFILFGVIPDYRFSHSEEYRKHLISDVSSLALNQWREQHPASLYLTANLPVEVNLNEIESGLRANSHQNLVKSWIKGGIVLTLGFGLLFRWRLFRVFGFLVGSFSAVAAIVLLILSFDKVELEKPWVDAAMFGVLALFNLVGLTRRGIKQEFRRRAASPKT